MRSVRRKRRRRRRRRRRGLGDERGGRIADVKLGRAAGNTL